MILYPAIDLSQGQCVRLREGDFNTTETVAADPVETACAFLAKGARWIHMVDLDGALQGKGGNVDAILRVAATGAFVQAGGGIRSMETVEKYLAAGIRRVVLGSAAIDDPALVRTAAAAYEDRIAVGIDAKDGFAKSGGWLVESNIHYLELAKRMEDAGVQTIIYTDIARDGMLNGPNLDQLEALKATIGCRVIASGGVRDLEDIRDLKNIGMDGAICGRSVYAGTLDLSAAVMIAAE